MATPDSNLVSLTGNPLIDGLLNRSSWTLAADRELTYSLHNLADGSIWTSPEVVAVDRAFAAWEAVANIDFRRLGAPNLHDFLTSPADLAVGFTGLDLSALVEPGTLGLAVFPSRAFGNVILNYLSSIAGEQITRTDYPNPEGDIFIDDFSFAWYPYIQPGDIGFATILHEIGHALGLKHPHDNSAGRSFNSLGIGELDSELFSVMSYNDIPAAGLGFGHPATPMLLDILVIQEIYGPNMTHRAGNDTYVLKNNGVLQTIWDAGGQDTFDGSQLTFGFEMDLREGWGTIISNVTATLIAYNVSIENGNGGAGGDTISGNVARNQINGNAGADKLSGLGGSDVLNGGAGVDQLVGGAGDDVLRGSFQDDVLAGGAGADTLNGGAGSDRFVFDTAVTAANADQIADYSALVDFLSLSRSRFAQIQTAAGESLAAEEFHAGTNGIAADADDRIVYNTSTGELFYDRDGNGPAAPIKFATLGGAPQIDAEDILIVG
jgi:hypothetical protein